MSQSVFGCDFENPNFEDHVFNSFANTGFQASNLYKAKEIMCDMIERKFSNVNERNIIILSYTSNMVSCGVRESIKFLVKHKMVDAIVSTAGGIEEDFIKCMAPTLFGDFTLSGKYLREQSLNRIGNLLIPSNNYCLFEDWLTPILDKLMEEQKNGISWTPSSIIRRLGIEINNEDSIYYWASKNDIPIFSPALTDGALGDVFYHYSIKNPGLKIDILEDLILLNNFVKFANCSSMIILGGGLIKHHTCNANLMRNGAEYSVFINTSSEYDGSDSGASPDEAVSWGKIKSNAKYVKVFCDASIAFPMLICNTFAKFYHSNKTLFR